MGRRGGLIAPNAMEAGRTASARSSAIIALYPSYARLGCVLTTQRIEVASTPTCPRVGLPEISLDVTSMAGVVKNDGLEAVALKGSERPVDAIASFLSRLAVAVAFIGVPERRTPLIAPLLTSKDVGRRIIIV